MAHDLPLLFALQAAPQQRIREGLVEQVSRALLEAQVIEPVPAQANAWSDFTVLTAVVSSFRRGYIAREGMAWRLTATGREQLQTAGLEPDAKAQELAAAVTQA